MLTQGYRTCKILDMYTMNKLMTNNFFKLMLFTHRQFLCIFCVFINIYIPSNIDIIGFDHI